MSPHRVLVVSLQPAEEMAQLLTDTMREMLSTQTHTGCAHKSTTAMTAKHSAGSAKGPRSSPHKEDVCVGNMFESTAVKYTVFEVTPFKKRWVTGLTVMNILFVCASVTDLLVDESFACLFVFFLKWYLEICIGFLAASEKTCWSIVACLRYWKKSNRCQIFHCVSRVSD